jgi:cholesterol oxidase
VSEKPLFAAISAGMRACVTALGGTYIANPRWSELGGRNLITVHPLGGCPMADRADDGVVNGYGEVWKPDGGLHQGLFVSDGAILPDSVGVNPLWTISALAERTAAHIAGRKDLKAVGENIPVSTPAIPKPPLGLEFSETMRGFVAPVPVGGALARTPEEYKAAFERGKQKKIELAFQLTMFVDDLERFIADPDHLAQVEGFVDSSELGVRRRVERGTFNLFAPSADRNFRQMLYKLPFTGKDGRRYLLDGFKDVRDDRGLDLWTDNTTLFTSVKDGDGQVVAQGVLRIGLAGFLKLLSTISVRHGTSTGTSARAVSRFGRFFVGSVWDSYIATKLPR